MKHKILCCGATERAERNKYLHHRRKSLLLPCCFKCLVHCHQVEKLHLILCGHSELEEDPFEDPFGFITEGATEQSQAARSLLSELLQELTTTRPNRNTCPTVLLQLRTSQRKYIIINSRNTAKNRVSSDDTHCFKKRPHNHTSHSICHSGYSKWNPTVSQGPVICIYKQYRI